MTSYEKVLFFTIVLLALTKSCCGDNDILKQSLKNVFLSQKFSTVQSEWILRSGRESYLILREIEINTTLQEKFNFVQYYSLFLTNLIYDIQNREMDIYYLFAKENSYLRDYRSYLVKTAYDDRMKGLMSINITGLKDAVEELEITVEEVLIARYNSTNDFFDVTEVFTLNETKFQEYLQKNIRGNRSEIGYFFLEIFATLVGLSWGIISAVLHVSDSMYAF